MTSRQAIEVRHVWALALALVANLVCFAWGFAGAADAAEVQINRFSAPGVNADGSPSTLAGDHPFELRNEFTLSRTIGPEGRVGATENIKNLSFELPPGMLGNAQDFPQCPAVVFDTLRGCPMNTQIGVARVRLMFSEDEAEQYEPVYNLVPPPGQPAQFGFKVVASLIHINPKVRSGSDYGVSATLTNLLEVAPVYRSAVTIWGVPADPSHDDERFEPGGPELTEEPEPYPGYPDTARPLLTNPTSCTGDLFMTMDATFWQHPQAVRSKFEKEPGMEGCGDLDFEPTIEAKATTNLGDSPSGFDFHLNLPQNEDPNGRATAELRASKVTLPSTLTVNPSSANGLGACTVGQIGYVGSNQKQTLYYDLPAAQSFTVSRGGQTTAPISARGGQAEVAQALETLPGLAGNIQVGGQPGAWTVTFTGALAGTDQPQLTGSVSDNPIQNIDITGTGGNFNFISGAEQSGVKFKASVFEGSSLLLLVGKPLLAPGREIAGPGIPPGTTITGSFGEFAFMSASPTETVFEGDYETRTVSYNAPEARVENAFLEMPSMAGKAFVTGLGRNGATSSYEVVYVGREAAPLTAGPGLTGPGAGISVSEAPATPHALEVKTLAASNKQFTDAPASCPDSSKLGTVRIDTPVLDHPLTGNVYLAAQNENPFDSLLAMYIAIDDAPSGVVVKLPGLIEADPQTGQLTATVTEAPQLPFEDLRIEFFRGAGAPLKTGFACGEYKVATDMVPWTAPEGAVHHPGDSFQIEHSAGGGDCVADEGAAPNKPSFQAGTLDPTSGIYSPFVLKLTRQDGEQQLTGIDTTLPKGLIAKLAGVAYCPGSALSAAGGRSGRAELASPSCPAASKIGSVNVAAGAGPSPFHTSGEVYLAGPYKGAPLSLAVITPAVAGPFDLGNVVVRTALRVDPETAQVRAISDPFPSILKGIPLDLRSVSVLLDRSSFVRNPTNCNPLSISGLATALTGQTASLSGRFQVGECARLAFKPKLSLTLKGGTKRSSHPALKAVLTMKEGESNIAGAAVTLPRSEFLENAHIKTICTRVQFAADTCPQASIYGRARAFTPLLDKPLEGPVYLRSSSHELPDLVADLRGQIDIALVGRIDSVNRSIRNTFETVPDAPVSKFVLEMQGGKKGLLVNNRDLCKTVNKATAIFDGQSGKISEYRPVVGNSCKKKHKKAAGKHKAKGGKRPAR